MVMKLQMSVVLNQVPVTYYQQGVKKNLLQRIWHTTKLKTAKKIINGLQFSKCLDVGCASGYMISEISKTFPNATYYGIDAYQKAINHAKATYPHINFKQSKAEELPFKNDQFDVIICYETLEHVENPKIALKEIKRVLKDDGVLILTMDSGSLLFNIVWFIWERTKGRVWQGSHLHPFKHSELEENVRSARFKILQKKFTHLGMEVTFVLKKS